MTTPVAPLTGSEPAPQATPAPAAPAVAPVTPPTPQAPATPAPAKSLLGQIASDPVKGASGDTPKEAAKAYELKAPEGFTDTALLSAYTKQANELGLSQEAAQKLFDALPAQIGAGLQARIDESARVMAEAAKADAEFGGAKWDASKQTMARGMEALGVTPALRDILDRTGLGSHPDVIRVFYRAGLKLSPDKIVGTEPAGAAPAEVHPAQILYTTMKQS